MKTLHQRIVEHSFISSMLPEHQAVLVECAQEMKFDTDQILFREGQPANQLFLIERGRIQLESHRLGKASSPFTPVQVLGEGEVLGWSWLFPPFTWHLQARALEPTSVIVLNGGHLLATAERDTQFGYCLMKRVARVVIQRLQATRIQLSHRDPQLPPILTANV